MNDFEKIVEETIKENKLIEKGDKIVVAVSGGPDSISLLNILNKIRKNCQIAPSPLAIVVAHVNHMIRKEASLDEEYVRNFCNKIGVEFFSKSIDVQDLANNNKMSTEEAGRFARYDFFNEVLKKTNSNKIAIAHNKNDRVETVIMNILRGTGVSGLKGIEVKKDNKYIRPLINCDRNIIEKYCEEENLDPRIDKTNFENDYTRNKIRNVVIPYIKEEFNPNITQTITRLANLVKDEDEYIKKEVKKAYKNLLIEENEKEIVIDLKKFNNEEKLIKSRLILYIITIIFGSSKGIEKVHVEDVIKMCEKNIGNKFLTPNKKIKILVKNHKIFFTSQM